MRGAYRLATPAAQAVLDSIGNGADVRLLHDEGLVSHQAEARRVGTAQVGTRHELAAVEAAVRIDALFVVAEAREFGVGQILELGNADAMLTRDDPVEAPCN